MIFDNDTVSVIFDHVSMVRVTTAAGYARGLAPRGQLLTLTLATCRIE